MAEDTAIAPQRIIQISTPENGDGVVALDDVGGLWLLPLVNANGRSYQIFHSRKIDRSGVLVA